MKFRQIIFTLLLIIVFFCPFQPEACAQKGAYVAEFICEYAKNLYDQGILEEAKHEFSKALIIDPDNVMAKSYLKKMGLDTGKYQVERPDLAVSQLMVMAQAPIGTEYSYGALVFTPPDKAGVDEVGVLSAQLMDLKKQIHALQEAVASKEGDVKAKGDEVSFLKEKFILAQEKLEQLHKDASQRDQLLAKLKSQISALEASSSKQLDLYKVKLETLESSVSKVNASMDQGQAQSQQDAAREFSEGIAGLRAQLDVLQREADGKDGDLVRMRNMLWALEMASAAQIKKYQDALEKLEGAVALKSNEAGAKQQSVEMLAQELALSENQSKSLQEELALKNRELEEVKAKVMSHVEFSDKTGREHGQEMNILRSSLTEVKKELSIKEFSLDELEKKLAEVQQEAAFLKNEVLEKTGKTKNLKESFFLKEKAIKEKEEAFRQLSVQSERLKLEVDKLAHGVQGKEAYIKKLAAEFEDYKGRLDRELHGYRSKIKNLEPAIIEKDKIIRREKERVSILDKELTAAREELEVFRKGREEVASLKDGIIKKHVQELAYAQGELKSLKEVVEDKDKALKELNQRLEDQIYSSQKELMEQKEKTFGLEKSLVLGDEALKEINEKLARSQQEFDGLRNDIHGKEGQLSVLNEQTNALKVDAVRQLREYEDEVKSLKDSLTVKEQEAVEKQNSIVRLNEELTSAFDELVQLRSDASDRVFQIQQLKEEIGSLKDILGRHFQTYDDQISTLQSSFSSARDLKDAKEQMRNLAIASGRQLKVYHDKMKALKSSLKQFQEDLELKNNVIAEKSAQAERLHAQLAQAREALSDLGRQVAGKEAQIISLQGRLRSFMRASGRQFKALKQCHDMLKDVLLKKDFELKEKNSQISVMRADLSQKNNDLRKSAGELAIAEKALQESRDELILKEREMVGLKSRIEFLSRDTDEQLKGYQKEMEALKEAFFQKERLYEASASGLKEKESLISELTEKLSQSQKDTDEIKGRVLLKEARAAELEKQLAQQKESLEKEINLHQGSLSVMESSKAKQDEDLVQKQKMIEGLLAAKGELEAAIHLKDEALKAEKDKLAGQNMVYQDHLNIVEKSLLLKDQLIREKEIALKDVSDKLALAMEDAQNKEAEISRQRIQLEDFEKNKKASELQMDEYQQQMKALESVFAAKKDDYYKQELLAKDLAAQFALIKGQLERAIVEKEAALKDVQGKLYLASEERDCLKKEAVKKEADFKNLSLKNAITLKVEEEKVNKYEQRLQSLEGTYNKDKKLLSEKEKLIGGHELTIKSLEEKVAVFDTRAKEHQARISSQQAEIEELKNSLRDSQERGSRYEDQFETLEALLSDKNFQLQGVKVKVDGQAATFGKQLVEYKNKITSLETALEAKNKELVDKGAVVKAKDMSMEAMEDDYSRAKTKISQLQNELTVKEGIICRLENELKDTGGLAIGYTQKISYLENLLAAKEGDLQIKSKDIASKDTESAGLAGKLAAAEEELVVLKRTLSNKEQKEGELASLKEQLEVLNKDFAVSGKKGREYQERICILEKSLENKNREFEKIMGTGDEKEKLIRDLYAKIEYLEAELGTYKSSVADKDAQFKNIKEEVEDLASMADQQKDSYERKIGTLETSMVAKEKLAQLNNEIKTLASSSSRQLEMYREQLGILESSLSGKDGQIQKQDSLLRTQADELQQKEDVLKDLSQKFEQAQAALKDIRDELSAKDILIDGYKEKIKDLAAAAGRQLKGHKDLLNRLSGKNEKLEFLVEEKDEVLKARENELNATMEQLRQSLKSEIKDYQAKLDMAQKGIVVGVLADVLFDSGSAEMSTDGKKVLTKISDVLKKIPSHNHIVIEGHTDNVPIRYSRWSSNWELSSQRALSVLEYLIQESGLDPMRFSAQGYGEYRPVADNDTNPGRKQNRRVEIVIQPQLKKVDAQELPVFSDSVN